MTLRPAKTLFNGKKVAPSSSWALARGKKLYDKRATEKKRIVGTRARALLAAEGVSLKRYGLLSVPTKLDHCVIHVAAGSARMRFITTVLGAELIERPTGFAYRLRR